MSKQKKKTIIAVVILVVVVALAMCAWLKFKPTTSAGAKTLEIQVFHGDGSEKDFTVKTDEEYLRGALEQENIISGSEDQTGLFVTTVDGETADDTQQQWWCFTKGGETVMTGVDATPIADGEQYEITLTTGW